MTRKEIRAFIELATETDGPCPMDIDPTVPAKERECLACWMNAAAESEIVRGYVNDRLTVFLLKED